MIKIFGLLFVCSFTLLQAQDSGLKRIVQPSVPKVSKILFGESQSEATTVDKDEPESAEEDVVESSSSTSESVQSDLPALGPLPDAEVSDPLTLFNQLPPLPESSTPVRTLKKKVNGKWVITAKRDTRTQFEVREVNGRKVIYPK